MGAAPSFRLGNSSIAEGKESSPTSAFSNYTGLHRNGLTAIPNEEAIRITKELLRTSEHSWKKIATDHGHQSRGENCGLFIFCDRFFLHMETLDVDNIALHNFKPRSISRCPSRTALLLKVIKYMLSLPDDSFSSKSKIRRLGRAHATRGIREPHFRIFAEAFMRSFSDVLGSDMRPEMARSWSLLLEFFVRELSFENVSFVPHIFLQSDAAAAKAVEVGGGSPILEIPDEKGLKMSSEVSSQEIVDISHSMNRSFSTPNMKAFTVKLDLMSSSVDDYDCFNDNMVHRSLDEAEAPNSPMKAAHDLVDPMAQDNSIDA
jgi:hypothetical protein